MSETTSNLCKNKEIVDLFCGGGGFTTGALAAGWKVVLAVEGDEKIASIYKKNNEEHDVRVLLIDEETGPLLAREIREKHPNAHCHGSPPCQLLSKANRTTRNETEGLRLVNIFLDIVSICNPPSWSMEQVFDKSLIMLLEQRGVLFCVVDASDFGVPQRRKRVIAGSENVIRHVRDRVGNGPTLLPKDVLSHLTPHTRYRLGSATFYQPCRKREAYGSVTKFLRRVLVGENVRSLEEPCHTVVTHPGRLYDTETKEERYLTVEECALLQGFPPTFRGEGKVRSLKVIGNAVPPPLAKYILSFCD